MALELYKAQLEDHHKDTQQENISFATAADFHPRSNEALCEIPREFGWVARLWAAVLFVQQD